MTMTTQTIAEMAQTNPDVSFYRHLGLTLPDDQTVTEGDKTAALVEGAAWFAIKEQAIVWSLLLMPKTFGKLALFASSIGLTTGILREMLLPPKDTVLTRWTQSFESNLALKRSVRIFFTATGLSRTIVQVGLSILLKREMLLINALRVIALSHHMGRNVYRM